MHQDIQEIRASSADRINACPPSAIPPKVMIDTGSDAADVGTAVHARLAAMISDPDAAEGLLDLPFEGVVGVQQDDARRQTYWGWKWWTEQGKLTGETFVERELRCIHESGVVLCGHPDYYSQDRDTVCIVDFKTGRKEETVGKHEYQMLLYSWLVLRELPEAVSVSCPVVLTRERAYELFRWSREEVEQRIASFIKRLDSQVYSPGEHCQYCPRALECPALGAATSQALTVFGAAQGDITDERIIGAYRALQTFNRLEGQWRTALRARIAAGGPIVADGQAIVLREKTKRVLDPERAWPVMETRLTAAELSASVDIVIGRVETAIKAKAPPRKGAEQVKELWAALDAAGAVTRTVSHELALVPADRALQKESNE